MLLHWCGRYVSSPWRPSRRRPQLLRCMRSRAASRVRAAAAAAGGHRLDSTALHGWGRHILGVQKYQKVQKMNRWCSHVSTRHASTSVTLSMHVNDDDEATFVNDDAFAESGERPDGSALPSVHEAGIDDRNMLSGTRKPQ
eukprot:COSAG01_NODE_138_length_24329_cov_45.428229_9_plen_141_part_00